MSAHRVSPGGSYRIQMIVKGVGRIAVASGAQTVGEYRKRRACLEKLRDTGRLEILRAIKRRQLSVGEVYAADLEGRLGFVLADLVLQKPLRETMTAWLERSAKAQSTRTRYRVAWNVLAQKVGRGTIRDLEALDWNAWANEWEASAAHWNHLRRLVSKFLSDQLGKHHPWRHQVLERIPHKKERPRMPDMTVAEFWRVIEVLPEELRPAYVTLVATGMRVSEFRACTHMNLRHPTCTIAVPGTKTAGSEATIPVSETLWPFVKAAIPCPFSHWMLWRRWRDACVSQDITPITLHDLRHLTGQWLTQAGRPEASVQAMLRHERAATTRLYTAVVMKREDADAMGEILKRGA